MFSISLQNVNKASFRDCSCCCRFVVRFPERISFLFQQGTKKRCRVPVSSKGRQKRYKNNDGHISLGGEPSGM